ncbi:hypothetical protein ACMG4J_22600 [Rossellomorea marisflavi]|uniref:hypothetical protein n=1 Tax=Rossellomorea marisflavi TaxID=189381 RepID=UPI0039BF7D91
MSNLPPKMRKWLENQKDYSLKERTKLMEEMDEYFHKRKKRIQKKIEVKSQGESEPD